MSQRPESLKKRSQSVDETREEAKVWVDAFLAETAECERETRIFLNQLDALGIKAFDRDTLDTSDLIAQHFDNINRVKERFLDALSRFRNFRGFAHSVVESHASCEQIIMFQRQSGQSMADISIANGARKRLEYVTELMDISSRDHIVATSPSAAASTTVLKDGSAATVPPASTVKVIPAKFGDMCRRALNARQYTVLRELARLLLHHIAVLIDLTITHEKRIREWYLNNQSGRSTTHHRMHI